VPRRLYRQLIGFDPSDAALTNLASLWGANGDVRAVASAIVRSPEFLTPAAIGIRAKTPVELIVSGAKALRVDLGATDLGWQMNSFMNQHPFFPPNVSGWPSGKLWLNAGVTMTWCSIVQAFAQTAAQTNGGVPSRLLSSATPTTAAQVAARLCGVTDLTSATASALHSYATGATWDVNRAAGTLALVLVSPEFAIA
jgi:uncharacterized protein (DUF1800 family)